MPGAPAIRMQVCYVPSCTPCGARMLGAEDSYEMHFDSEEAALAVVRDEDSGWTVDANGRLNCPSCVARLLCNQQGHDWSPWQSCVCEGRIASHACTPELTSLEIQWCTRAHCGSYALREATNAGSER